MTKSKELTRLDIDQLAERINDLNDRCEVSVRATVEIARECGEALLVAKRKLLHGMFQTWLGRHCPRISVRQAQRYMRIAREFPKLGKASATSHLTIDGALKLLSTPKKPDDPVATINHSLSVMERLEPIGKQLLQAVEYAEQMDDPEACLRFCKEIIDIATEAQQRLGEARVRGYRAVGQILAAQGKPTHPMPRPGFQIAGASQCGRLVEILSSADEEFFFVCVSCFEQTEEHPNGYQDFTKKAIRAEYVPETIARFLSVDVTDYDPDSITWGDEEESEGPTGAYFPGYVPKWQRDGWAERYTAARDAAEADGRLMEFYLSEKETV